MTGVIGMRGRRMKIKLGQGTNRKNVGRSSRPAAVTSSCLMSPIGNHVGVPFIPPYHTYCMLARMVAPLCTSTTILTQQDGPNVWITYDEERFDISPLPLLLYPIVARIVRDWRKETFIGPSSRRCRLYGV